MLEVKKLETIVEQSDDSLRNKGVGDKIWLTEPSTGLLMKATIMHHYHVPSRYVEQLSTIEPDMDNIVWARVDLGNGHFTWHAIYADAPVYTAPVGVKDTDKFSSHHSFNRLKKEPDFHADGVFRKELY